MVNAFLVLLVVIAALSLTALISSFAIWACTKIWRSIRSGENLFNI